MSKILAIDTATENCSVALQIGDSIIARCACSPREHTQKILPMVDEVLAEAGITLAQLDALAFGQGPGSFTGVRIGIGIAQGLAFGADLPLVGISTLAAMAQQVYRLHGIDCVLPTIDARMGELYAGGYQRQASGDWQVLYAERVITPDLFVADLQQHAIVTAQRPCMAAGTGWQAYPAMAEHLASVVSLSQVQYPQAEDMLLLAKFALARDEAVAAELASPVYLRDTVTWKKLPGRE